MRKEIDPTKGYSRSTSEAHIDIRQKLHRYKTTARTITLDNHGPLYKPQKCHTRIINFAKYIKIPVGKLINLLNEEGFTSLDMSSLIDNRNLSSLVASGRVENASIHKSVVTFENISFQDGFVLINQPHLHSLSLLEENSFATLNLLHNYWLNINEKFEIYFSSNKIIAINPFPDISKYIMQLYGIVTDGTIDKDGKNCLHSSLSLQETLPQKVIERGIAYKSPYIDYLSLQHQCDVIYRCLEINGSSKEESFIFSIPITNGRVALVFENITFGRSTELFISTSQNSKSCVEQIFRWFASYKGAKRNDIRSKRIANNFFCAIEYQAVPHISINQWMQRINDILCLNTDENNYIQFSAGFKCSTDVNGEIFSSGYKVENIHNVLMRTLYHKLNAQYPNQVGCEIPITGSHRIDVVVRCNDNSYEFYEIKSYDTAFECIKEGVGQLMNYKFLVRDCCHISKLVIVGRADMTKEVEDYFAMYNSEELPISYLQIKI